MVDRIKFESEKKMKSIYFKNNDIKKNSKVLSL